MIRKAKISDVREIQKMVDFYSKRGEMLPRSLSEMYSGLRDFYVYQDPTLEQIIGACAMHICWDDLAEIRSLVVREKYMRQGIGTKLVEAFGSDQPGNLSNLCLNLQTGVLFKIWF